MPGGEYAEAHRHGNQDQDREGGEEQGRAEAVGEESGHRPPRGERGPEVAVQQPHDPVGQPLVGGAVQSHRLAYGRDALRVGLVTGEGHRGVARQRLGEPEDQQHDGRGLQDAEEQPPGDPGAQRVHASQTLSKRAQSRVLAGASRATPRREEAVPRIQSPNPQTRKPPSACSRRCIRV